MKKSTRGRKPSSDKKIPVTIYLNKSVVKANGGIEELRSHLTNRAINVSIEHIDLQKYAKQILGL